MVVVTVFSPAGKPARSRVMPAQDIPLSWPVCAPAGATDHAPSRAHAITARANRLILLLSRDWLPVRRPSLLCDAGGPRIPPPRLRRTHRAPQSCAEAREFLQGPARATDERAVRQVTSLGLV